MGKGSEGLAPSVVDWESIWKILSALGLQTDGLKQFFSQMVNVEDILSRLLLLIILIPHFTFPECCPNIN